MGLILVSTGRIARGVCYQGDVFGFLLNQSSTTINAKNRIAGGLASFKAALTPSYAAA